MTSWCTPQSLLWALFTALQFFTVEAFFICKPHVRQGCNSQLTQRKESCTSSQLTNALQSNSPLDDENVYASALSRLLQECATERSANTSEVIAKLEELESSAAAGTSNLDQIDLRTALDGQFELVFSSAVANLPLLGNIWGGYMPNREIITFDFRKKEMSLIVELFPFLPTIDIYGDSLALDESNATLEYLIRGKEELPPSQWKILYADDNVVAARSSVTGLNVIRRLY